MIKDLLQILGFGLIGGAIGGALISYFNINIWFVIFIFFIVLMSSFLSDF